MNCRFLFLIGLLTFNFQIGKSQNVNYNKIIPSDSIANKNISEKLVLLAWKNNPDNTQVIDASKGAQYDWKLTKITWLNTIVASGNLNEFTISPHPGVNNIFFPRYNFSLTLPLGIYPVNHLISKSAQKKYDVSVDEINSQKLEIRRKVLNAYQDLLLYQELLRLQTQISDDASTDFLVMQKKFKENRGTLQAYNEAQQKYTSESINKLSAQRNYNVAKNDLERLIGISLDQVIKN